MALGDGRLLQAAQDLCQCMQLHLCLHPHLAVNGATEKVLVIIGVEVKGSHKISVPAAASMCYA